MAHRQDFKSPATAGESQAYGDPVDHPLIRRIVEQVEIRSKAPRHAPRPDKDQAAGRHYRDPDLPAEPRLVGGYGWHESTGYFRVHAVHHDHVAVEPHDEDAIHDRSIVMLPLSEVTGKRLWEHFVDAEKEREIEVERALANAVLATPETLRRLAKTIFALLDGERDMDRVTEMLSELVASGLVEGIHAGRSIQLQEGDEELLPKIIEEAQRQDQARLAGDAEPDAA